jgi:hypothetical protein
MSYHLREFLEIKMGVLHKFSAAMAGVGFALLQVASLPLYAAPPVVVPVQILDPSGLCDHWDTGGTLLAPTITCMPASTAGAPVCTITANGQNPLTISAAGLVALSATCTNTDALTTWAWTGAGAAPTTGPGVSPQGQSVTVSANTTFGVTATNASGPSVNKTVAVTVGAPPPPPPAEGTCTIGTRTFTILDMGLQPFATANTTTAFSGSNIAIATLLVPSGYLTTTNSISVFEYAGGTTWRHAWLSKTRCDQAGGSVLPAYPAYLESSGPVFNYTIGGNDQSAVRMLPGETWYLHVTNQKLFGSQASSCTSGYCNIGIKWYPPN